jgi:hypothetical protein
MRLGQRHSLDNRLNALALLHSVDWFFPGLGLISLIIATLCLHCKLNMHGGAGKEIRKRQSEIREFCGACTVRAAYHLKIYNQIKKPVITLKV